MCIYNKAFYDFIKIEREKHGRTRKFEARHGRAFVAYAAANRKMENLQSNVAEYLESCPGAAMADIEARFGTAESFANAVLCALEPQGIRIYARK